MPRVRRSHEVPRAIRFETAIGATPECLGLPSRVPPIAVAEAEPEVVGSVDFDRDRESRIGDGRPDPSGFVYSGVRIRGHARGRSGSGASGITLSELTDRLLPDPGKDGVPWGWPKTAFIRAIRRTSWWVFSLWIFEVCPGGVGAPII